MATLTSIHYKPAGTTPAQGFLRESLQEATLIEGYGIENDRKGGNPKRNLNVMDDLTLAELAAEGYPTQPGILGENLIISGLDLRTLSEGAQLRIGAEAVITATVPRVPCEQLTDLDDRMPEKVIGRVGMMCRVVTGGKIKVGDSVEVLQEPVNA